MQHSTARVFTPSHATALARPAPPSIPLGVLALAVLASLAATSALAQDTSYAPYYFGVGAGQSRANVDGDGLASSLLPAGTAATSIDRDQNNMAYKVFGGYQMNRNLALEAGYFKLGTIGFNANTAPPGALSGQMRTEGVNLDLVGTIALTPNLSALARAGLQYAQASDSFHGSGAVSGVNFDTTKKSTNVKLGLGMQYAFSPAFLVRGEVERYRINGPVGGRSNADVYSVSLVFPFGGSSSPQRVAAAPAPAYVAPMPAPMPAPAPVAVAAPPPPVAYVRPVPPAPVQVNYSADSMFGFDNAGLKNEGKKELDKFVADLQGSQYERIEVVGNTDRLGSSAYNQKLSEQRAATVKTYLVRVGGLPDAKVTAAGVGETHPVTAPGDCVGTRQTPALIACLQPDRRVDVTVHGTRPAQ